MQEKTCCIIGFGKIPPDKADDVKRELEREVKQALEDGYRTFLSRLSDRLGLMTAACVLEQKRQHSDIFLEAVLPYANCLLRLGKETDEILAQCSDKKVISEKRNPNCHMLCSRYMVQQSSRVIAVYDGHDGDGNLFAMDYAQTMERDLRIINI